ncbi:MAG: alginate export family protein [Bacteroidota bacterium]
MDQRANEDYSHLKDSSKLSGLEKIKFVPLGQKRNAHLSFGGSTRHRYEHFTNQAWLQGNDENFYSQRFAFHADLVLGKHIRFFNELQHGLKTGGETFLQTDHLDIHQSFLEVSMINTDSKRFAMRLGRQEIKLGSGRLMDLRIGPNVRRSFNMTRIYLSNSKINIDAFYGKETPISFKVLDNQFNLFNDNVTSPKTWGVYSQFSLFQGDHKDEIYYLGFQSDFSGFNDVLGKEIRHSLGLRRFGTVQARLTYNSEFIFQFGDLAGRAIRAFNFETDWKYLFSPKQWRPTIGLGLDWSSGDRKSDDQELNSFNPMFVNPATYSLAAINTPVNLFSVHPSLFLFPSKKLLIKCEFATFYRSSAEDGFYSPPRFQSRESNGISDRHLGNVLGLFLKYTFNESINFDLRNSLFLSGDFIQKSGASASVFQFAPTFNLTF